MTKAQQTTRQPLSAPGLNGSTKQPEKGLVLKLTTNTAFQPTAWRLNFYVMRAMTDMTQPNAKVLFRVPNEDGTSEVETLWATHLGSDNYKLDNSPFYIYGISWEDIVYAPFCEEEQFPTFRSIVEKSGNRTVRVIFNPPIEEGNQSDRVLQGLVALGCSYEGANRTYVSVNIPPNVGLETVRNYLIEKNVTWEHADPTYASLYPEDA